MFTKDTRTETFLRSMNVQFSCQRSIDFNDLLDGWAGRNLARPVPVRDDAVENYAELMATGSLAPATILARKPEGLDVLDGVQRLVAASLQHTRIGMAYVVRDASETKITRIRLLANARLQGRAEPIEWTRRRAVEVLVVEQGEKPQCVAKLGGWITKQIQEIADAILWGRSVEAIGGPALPDTMLAMIGKYTTEDAMQCAPAPIAAFLSAVQQAKFSAVDAELYLVDFFAPIRKKSTAVATYEQRLKNFLDDAEVNIRISGRRVGETPLDVQLLRSLKAASTVLDKLVAAGRPVSYVDEYFQLLGSLKDRLHDLPNKRCKASKPAVPADMYRSRK